MTKQKGVSLFTIDKRPTKGLLKVEKVALIYLLLTAAFTIVCFTKLPNPEAMLWGRVRIVAMTLALWLVYRMVPCPLTRLARVVGQLALLSWWYPDTYELNRILPNLDHVFASLEESLFACQPALLFPEAVKSPVFSELMDLGYASYYPMIAVVTLFYFFRRNKEFERAAYIVAASFFLFYVIFVAVPVVGPTFYYKAVGLEQIRAGVFPALGTYFNFHTECLPSPGWTDGVFYHLVESAKAAGERPTAAFPSSHVGITTVLLWLAWHTGNRRLFFCLLPFGVLMFFATFYIQAHYLVDALAGLLAGTAMYFLFKKV